jgi:hypothetical protein
VGWFSKKASDPYADFLATQKAEVKVTETGEAGMYYDTRLMLYYVDGVAQGDMPDTYKPPYTTTRRKLS